MSVPPANDSRRVSAGLVVVFVLLVVGWGANWPIMKVALSEIEPLHFRALCLLVGGAVVLAAARFSGQRLRVPEGQWGRLVVVAVFNFFIWNVAAIYGLRLLESGRAAILAFTMPLWAVLLGAWVLKERITRRRAIALALGMTGMLLLLGAEIASAGRAPLGTALMLGSALSWAIGIVIMKRWPVDLPASSLAAWQMLVGGAPIFVGALVFEHGTFLPWQLSPKAGWSVVYTVVVAFVLCQWAWIKLTMLAPIVISSLSALLIPVFGVFSGMLILGERPQWNEYAALALVVAALAVVVLPARQPRLPSAA